ncbi:hypothetical protein FC52_GL001434 [Lactobacillus pasteurii DSM 23907 = CRBIP 24.76]|uniref:Transcriptional regulator, LysR family n=1 Tax=Lactobacillus pasteurii DSM 23907 = CRBIP 24.76 TaxID=1423790 RepID=I7LE62_9LACO|nr:LysR family transcriptional regulator [Lactobacillus pasteurii]KRK07744.1 hypothetical protein FC52_GL001434 [Lactobacillus pasteurii DSM 23907 = CRBIP 24.76]TDG77535.1 hypothetical protein C5L33_000978 [Lactobacillus pasteurii]CCI85503.1 Transcriptional regulator, LysR family [Lactobacillus pasteurii DSM 23907 = CRBIP 24.76]
MDIRQLNYFLTIADMQNYSHAAKILYVSQPALKQNISKMEEELHTQLFIYNNHHLQLTKTGQELYDRAKPLVKEFNQLIDDFKNQDRTVKTPLYIGVTFLTMLEYMDQISRFIRRNQQVDVHFIQEGSIKLQHDLVDGKIDVALLSFPQFEQDIIIDPLADESEGYTAYVVAPKSHPLAGYKELSFKDLKNSNIVSLSTNFVLGEFVKQNCEKYNYSQQVILVHDDFELILHSLNQLDAISILPKELMTNSTVKDLAWIPLTDSKNTYRHGIAYRKKLSQNASVIRQFIDHIKN